MCRLVCIHGRESSALSVLAMRRVQMDASSSDSSSPSANGRETNANDDGCIGQPISSVLQSFFPSLPTIYTLLSHLPCLSVPRSLPPSLSSSFCVCLSIPIIILLWSSTFHLGMSLLSLHFPPQFPLFLFRFYITSSSFLVLPTLIPFNLLLLLLPHFRFRSVLFLYQQLSLFIFFRF